MENTFDREKESQLGRPLLQDYKIDEKCVLDSRQKHSGMTKLEKHSGMTKRAQSTSEFTFAMIAVLFLLYGLIQVFRWVGMDIASRQYEHETQRNAFNDPAKQLNPDFYRPERLNAYGNTEGIFKREQP